MATQDADGIIITIMTAARNAAKVFILTVDI